MVYNFWKVVGQEVAIKSLTAPTEGQEVAIKSLTATSRC